MTVDARDGEAPPGVRDELTFFATSAKGVEGAVRDELRELRFRGVRADRGGVFFRGREEEGWRGCLELRTPMRVLREVARFEARSGEELYDGVRTVEWLRFLGPRQTLAVRASCRSSALTHTQFIAQKTKDAVVDSIRDRVGARPSVDLEDPDVVLFVHLVRDQAVVYLDLAGEPLHLRGWRKDGGEAPLKETLAAAILRLSGWDRSCPLVDPMCGSGTIPIEAALWSRGVAPGLARKRFGFERWAEHDEDAARRARALRERVAAKAVDDGPEIHGSDVDPRAVELATANARAAGVRVRFAVTPIRALAPLGRVGQIVTNPPYGERLPGSDALYAEMGAAFARMAGHRIAVLAGAPAVLRGIRLRPERALQVFNGAIECRLAMFVVGAGG